MSVNADGPVYQIKLDLNGRSYTATRHHNKLRSLVEQLKTRGYRILSPFPEVRHCSSHGQAWPIHSYTCTHVLPGTPQKVKVFHVSLNSPAFHPIHICSPPISPAAPLPCLPL